MSTSFETARQPEGEATAPKTVEAPAAEIAPNAVREKLNALSASVEAQPQQLADQGQSLGLTPEVTEQVLAEQDYPGRLKKLQDRMRRATEALTVAIALGAPAMAQAETAEHTERELSDKAIPTLVERQQETEQEKASAEAPASASEESDEEAEEDLGAEEEPEKKETTTEKGEVTEEREDAEKSEILKQFSDERLALYQDLVATIMMRGVTDPETMEKLGTLIGKNVQENKGAIAERLVAKAVPYYDGLKQIFEAVQGSKMSGKEITGFERLKHFSKGAFELALDSSQFGAVGRFLHKLNRAADIADMTESVIDYAGILREIQADPADPKILEKVLSLIEKKTLVERAKGVIENRAREAYEAGVSSEGEEKTL